MKKIKRNFVAICFLSSCLLLMSSSDFGPPKITETLKYVPYFMEGACCTHTAKVEARPSADFRCFLDNRDTFGRDGYIITFDGTEAKLVIDELYVEDSGKLTFQFTNNYGEATTSVLVRVFPWSNQ